MIVDCANNKELRDELIAYLKDKKIECFVQGDEVWTQKDLKKTELDGFLQKTGRISHKAQLVDKAKFLLSLPVTLDTIGMETCEFCGYIGYPEALEVHRRTHQAL